MKMEYLIATGRTETAVVTERDKFKFPTVRAGIHCRPRKDLHRGTFYRRFRSRYLWDEEYI